MNVVRVGGDVKLIGLRRAALRSVGDVAALIFGVRGHGKAAEDADRARSEEAAADAAGTRAVELIVGRNHRRAVRVVQHTAGDLAIGRPVEPCAVAHVVGHNAQKLRSARARIVPLKVSEYAVARAGLIELHGDGHERDSAAVVELISVVGADRGEAPAHLNILIAEVAQRPFGVARLEQLPAKLCSLRLLLGLPLHRQALEKHISAYNADDDERKQRDAQRLVGHLHGRGVHGVACLVELACKLCKAAQDEYEADHKACDEDEPLELHKCQRAHDGIPDYKRRRPAGVRRSIKSLQRPRSTGESVLTIQRKNIQIRLHEDVASFGMTPVLL